MKFIKLTVENEGELLKLRAESLEKDFKVTLINIVIAKFSAEIRRKYRVPFS